MSRPAWLHLAVALLLSGCGGLLPNEAQPTAPITVAPPPPRPQGPPPVALLLPLSGQYATIAASLRQAAQLAASTPGAPRLDIRDTAGDPTKAAIAAQQAINAGDALILGPLTAEETRAVAAATSDSHISILSFSSDPTIASPGVWPLGITPGQQMRRLINAARAEGRQHVAALLPEGPFGDALQVAILDAASQAGFPDPVIQRGGSDPASLDSTLKSMADFEARHGDLIARIKAMRASSDPAARAQAALLAAEPVRPPPFDVLVLAANGDLLTQTADLLEPADIFAPQVRILGPSFWSGPAARTGKLNGAWYALPDPSNREGFIQAYTSKFGAAPPPIADIAFDATLIARSLAGDHDFSISALAKPDGFSGVDGAILLLPDGHVRRGLAIYQIQPDGASTLVSPAPADLTSSGS